jgi:hypothetical protein
VRPILLVGASLIGCPSQPPAKLTALGDELELERFMAIRDGAVDLGITNGAVFAGIALSETHLAHCWSEATYACMGPPTPACDGESIIAGSADGACADQQGGLGLFQFDAGTYAETLAHYGDAILSVEGSTTAAVELVLERLPQSIPGVTDRASALDYLNSVPLAVGDAITEQWAQFAACRYNGCCADTAVCADRAAGYRDHAIAALDRFGERWWAVSDP